MSDGADHRPPSTEKKKHTRASRLHPLPLLQTTSAQLYELRPHPRIPTPRIPSGSPHHKSRPLPQPGLVFFLLPISSCCEISPAFVLARPDARGLHPLIPHTHPPPHVPRLHHLESSPLVSSGFFRPDFSLLGCALGGTPRVPNEGVVRRERFWCASSAPNPIPKTLFQYHRFFLRGEFVGSIGQFRALAADCSGNGRVLEGSAAKDWIFNLISRGFSRRRIPQAAGRRCRRSSIC